MFTKKEKTERPARPSIEYCVQVIKKTFTNDMVKEICSSEFKGGSINSFFLPRMG